MLWDGGMEYINGPSSSVRRRDVNRARRLVGLATRRELATKRHWQALFGIDGAGLDSLMATLAIPTSERGKLRNRAIRKLRAEAEKRGLSRTEGNDEEGRADTKGESLRAYASAVASPPLEWRTIGRERDIDFLQADDVRAIHYELVEEFATHSDPIEPPGVRDAALLDSAITRPLTVFGGVRKYPSVEMSAAALLHSLVHNHPFHNGNKRTAVVSMLSFLDLNRLLVTCREDELFKVVLRIAQHAIVPRTLDDLPDREVLFIADWIHRYSRRIELGDRNIPFRRLRKLLTRYGCSYGTPRANQIAVRRTIQGKDWLRRIRQRTLSARAPYSNEGREIGKVSIAKVRKDLHLDEPNGIDSASFYRNAPAAAGEFIVKYRKTLGRLARL